MEGGGGGKGGVGMYLDHVYVLGSFYLYGTLMKTGNDHPSCVYVFISPFLRPTTLQLKSINTVQLSEQW